MVFKMAVVLVLTIRFYGADIVRSLKKLGK